MSGKSLLTENDLKPAPTFTEGLYEHSKYLHDKCNELAGKVGAYEWILCVLREEGRLKPVEIEMFEKYETKDKPKIV